MKFILAKLVTATFVALGLFFAVFLGNYLVSPLQGHFCSIDACQAPFVNLAFGTSVFMILAFRGTAAISAIAVSWLQSSPAIETFSLFPADIAIPVIIFIGFEIWHRVYGGFSQSRLFEQVLLLSAITSVISTALRSLPIWNIPPSWNDVWFRLCADMAGVSIMMVLIGLSPKVLRTLERSKR